MKFAIWMLVIIAFVSLISMFIVEFYPIDTFMPNWEEVYAEKYGALFGVMKVLHLNDPYRAFWYQVLLAVLTLSLLLCVYDRLPKALKSTFEIKFIKKTGEFESYQQNAKLNIEDDFIGKIKSALSGYKVTQKKEEDKLLISANRSRLGYLGPVGTHIGMLFLLIGGLATIWGYASRGNGFPGDFIESDDFNFKVRVDDFNIVYYPLGIGQWVLVEDRMLGKIVKRLPDDKFRIQFTSRNQEFYHDVEASRIRNQFDIETDRGNIKDYVSALTVVDNDVEVKSMQIEVNKPLRYKGFRFYQTSFDTRRPKIQAEFDSVQVEISSIESASIIDTVWLPWDKELRLPDKTLVKSTRFLPHFQMSSDGIISASASMVNPAVELTVSKESDGDHLYHQWCFYGKEFHGASQDAKYSFKILEIVNPVAEAKYMTILEIKKNQGYFIIWAGLIIASIGLILSFYFLPQHIWITLEKDENKSFAYIAGYSPSRGSLFIEKFNEIVKTLRTKSTAK